MAVALDIVIPGNEYELPSLMDRGLMVWVPVFPTPHEDTDPRFFQNVEMHHHVDNRFIDNWSPNSVIRAGEVKMNRFTCLRADLMPTVVVWMQMALYQVFADHTLKDCRVCPHRAMPIFHGLCSGHGMRWGEDGRVKHKGPFKVRITGTKNTAPVTGLIRLDIDITEDYRGDFAFEFLDSEDRVITQYRDPLTQIDCVHGDVLKIDNKNYAKTQYAQRR